MRSEVKFSTFSKILTTGVIILLAAGLYSVYDTSKFIPALIITGVLAAFSLWFAPLSISLTDKAIATHSPLRVHSIPFEKIREVKLFQPTMGTFRLCASGGFMGYWGIFRESDIGSYTAFYGKASDCFLVTLKDGSRYILGCEAPADMVAAIKSRLS